MLSPFGLVTGPPVELIRAGSSMVVISLGELDGGPSVLGLIVGNELTVACTAGCTLVGACSSAGVFVNELEPSTSLGASFIRLSDFVGWEMS